MVASPARTAPIQLLPSNVRNRRGKRGLTVDRACLERELGATVITGCDMDSNCHVIFHPPTANGRVCGKRVVVRGSTGKPSMAEVCTEAALSQRAGRKGVLPMWFHLAAGLG